MINNTKTEILAHKPTLYLQRDPHSDGPIKSCPKIDKNTLVVGQNGAEWRMVICTLWNLILSTWEMINHTKTRILTLKPTLYLQRNPHYYGPLKICPQIYKNTLIGRA